MSAKGSPEKPGRQLPAMGAASKGAQHARRQGAQLGQGVELSQAIGQANYTKDITRNEYIEVPEAL